MVEIWCRNRLCYNPEIFKRHVLKSHLAATLRTPFYLIETLHSAAACFVYMLSNNPHFCSSCVCEKSSKHLWVNRSTKRLTSYRDVAPHFTIVVQATLCERTYIVAMLYFRRVPPNLHFPWPSTLISHLRCCTTVLNASKWCCLCANTLLWTCALYFRRAPHNLYFPWPSPSFLALHAGWQTAAPWCENLSLVVGGCGALLTQCALCRGLCGSECNYIIRTLATARFCECHTAVSLRCIFGSTNWVLNPINRSGKFVSGEKNSERLNCFVM
jgi:hypothetical protein